MFAVLIGIFSIFFQYHCLLASLHRPLIEQGPLMSTIMIKNWPGCEKAIVHVVVVIGVCVCGEGGGKGHQCG